MTAPSFEKLLAGLAEAAVKFVVVGGAAVIFHGYVRLTEDVDLLVDASPDNVRRLLDSLADFGEGYARELSLADFSDEEGAIRIVEETEGIQIDLFTRMGGLTYADIMSDADRFPVGRESVAVASKRALIHWKRASLRDKDRLDAQALEELQRNPRAFE